MENENATCSVCYIFFDVDDHIPRVLIGCGHTLCSSCLEEILSSPSLRKCPFDNQAFVESQNSPEQFPINFALLALLETRDVTRNEIRNEGKNEIRNENNCKIHKNLELTMVCLQDKVKICYECAVFGEHKGHSIKKIDELKAQKAKAKRDLEESLAEFEKNQLKKDKEIEKLKKEYLSKLKNKVKEIKRLFLKKELEWTEEIDNLFQKNFRSDQELKRAAEKTLEEINQAGPTNEDFLILDQEELNSVISSLQPGKVKKEDFKLAGETLKTMDYIESFLASQENSIQSFDLQQKKLKLQEQATSANVIPAAQKSASILEAKTLLTLATNNGSLFIAVENSSPIDTRVDLGELNKAERIQLQLEKYNSFVEGSPDFNFLSEILHQLDHYTSLTVWFASGDLTNGHAKTLFDLLFCRIQRLTKIEISFEGCKTADIPILYFCGDFLSKATSLKHLLLNLNGTLITDLSLSALAKVLFSFKKSLENLTPLLEGTQITDEGFEKISHVISGVQELQLGLNGTLVTDCSLKILRDVMNCMRNLKKLTLNCSETKITIEGISALLSGIPKEIEDLNLDFSHVKLSNEVFALIQEEFRLKLRSWKDYLIRFEGKDLIAEI